MVTTQIQHHDYSKTMSVNVALCGSIPRAHLTVMGKGAPCLKDGQTGGSRYGNGLTLDRSSTTTSSSLTAHHNNENMRPQASHGQQCFEAPTWAVPAPGEARLEPVSESYGRYRSVDLTQKSFFRIGRAPHCDVHLVHCTSSRRHAMLFHHTNGSCYVVDCGSAHGTFVNGVRISSPSNGGVVVPHKVRRGSLIRFGGPGAPSFVLKSFNFRLKEAFRVDASKPDMGELVRRNTRLNALGKSAADTVRDKLKSVLTDVLTVTRKRSFDSLSTSVTVDEDFDEPPSSKRIRCESPPLSPEVPLRLVSPDYCPMKAKRVTFAMSLQVHYPYTISPADSGEEDSI